MKHTGTSYVCNISKYVLSYDVLIYQTSSKNNVFLCGKYEIK